MSKWEYIITQVVIWILAVGPGILLTLWGIYMKLILDGWTR